MEFRVLGPLEVVGEAGAVPVGGPRERALLARLLLSANQVVSSDALTEDLWSGVPPEGAAQALWVHVSRLRKTLREHGGEDALVTRPPGYVLRVEPDALDSCRFEALVEQGRMSVASGDPAAAAATFREALALWRGPAFADVADAPFARAEAARLEELRLAALEARIEADLAGGADRDLIGELASLTREHPVRERLWALRMTALYRAGRQAEALRTYQELRRYLGEELGIEPSEELRRLEGAILRQEPHLARPVPAAAPPLPAPEPGVVTFMFTDVVGSTELLGRLGDAAADELRRRHFSSLREALATNGGTEVKSLGDGLMAAFASPVAALRCAVEIQRAVAGQADQPLAVRVGIHAGEPIADEDDFFGTPVVVAQRLCGRARGGQILASTLVQGLAGNRAGCTFTTLGGLSLKGFAEPVAACEVHWATPAVPEARPLPVPLSRQDSVFVRPEAVMTRVETAWEATRSGQRHLVLLAGEPGIGKTRLSAEIARTAHEDGGAAVLYGRCEEGMSVPYQPFVEALTTYLSQAPAPALGRLAGELSRLVPELRQRLPELPPPLSADPDTERYRLFDAVAAWLAAVAAETPTVLVIEDLHWATPPTLAMLGHLVRSGEPARLLVVGNYRDTRLDVTPDLAAAVAELLRQPDVDRIRLTGLDRAGVAAYMEAQARHELDADGREFAGVLHAETAGNPFFLNQVLRHLTETGAMTRSGGRWSAPDQPGQVDVPDTVRDVIAQRLARLPAETGDILDLAAVQGDRFDLRVLIEAAGQPQISVLRALDPAISARLVTEADGATVGHRFVHALVRHTLYDALPAARRMELHRAVGAGLASLAGDNWWPHAAELARHWLAAIPQVGATADEARRTLDYAEEAARRAVSSLAYEEAATQLTRALPLADLIGDSGRRAAILVALGEAQHCAGDSAHRHTLLEAANLALQVGDGELAARAALVNPRPLPLHGNAVEHDRVALLEKVLEALGPDDSAALARVLVALATALHFTVDPRRHDLAREAVAVARRLGDSVCLANVLDLAGFALWDPLTLTERVAFASESSVLAAELGDPILEVNSGVALYLAAGQQGDLDRAREALAASSRIAESLGQPALRLRTAFGQASCAMLEGRFVDAEHHAADALSCGEALATVDHLGMYRSQMFFIRFLQGRTSDAVELIEALAGLVPLVAIEAGRAAIYAESGRCADARAAVQRLRGSSLEALPRDYLRLLLLVLLARATSALDDRELAAWLYTELMPYRDQVLITQTSAVGPVAHYVGLLTAVLGRADEAEEHFAFAAELQERIGVRGPLVRTRLEWARLLLRRGEPGDGERARTLATSAAELAEELDTPGLAEQALKLLAMNPAAG